MQSLENLIQKFWQETISRDELGQLQQLLKKDEDGFKSMPNNVLPKGLADGDTFIEPEKAEHILQALHKKIAAGNKAPVIKKITNQKFWWAAAAIIFLISGFLVFTKIDTHKSIATALQKTIQPKRERKILNNTNGVVGIALADGSLVQLYPNSTITYNETFNSTKRDVELIGKAFFKVSKDKYRPFTVYANGFATTALGTVFSVDTKVENMVLVKLFEGKVVIKSTGKDSANWVAQYLLPNQQFIFNTLSKTYNITIFGNNAKVNNGKKLSKAPANQTSLLAFDNEPLQKVFTRLQFTSKIHLLFKKEDVDGLYFTGTFTEKDSIKSILSIICNINGLTFMQDGHTFKINKSK